MLVHFTCLKITFYFKYRKNSLIELLFKFVTLKPFLLNLEENFKLK